MIAIHTTDTLYIHTGSDIHYAHFASSSTTISSNTATDQGRVWDRPQSLHQWRTWFDNVRNERVGDV